jgi:hypothetical protein
MSIDLQISLSMMTARETNRRSTELAQKAQQATQQAAQQSAQQSVQQASGAMQQPAAQPPGAQPANAINDVGTAGAKVDAASARNDCACRSWGDFKQDGAAAVDAQASAPVTDAQRQALYSTETAAPAASSSTTEAAATGRRQTNQELINKYYQQGGGTWAGASQAARAEGRTLTELVKDRQGFAAPSSSSASANAPRGSGAAASTTEPAKASGSPGARAAGAQRASSTSGGAQVSGASLSGSAFGNQVADAAERSARRLNTVGQCALGVNNALTSVGVGGRGHAYQKAEQLAQNPRFREVNVSAGQLPNLPRGAVVVWGKSDAKPWGHVSVALGGGREASDHIQNQITGGRYGTNFGNGADPQGRQFRVFVPN